MNRASAAHLVTRPGAVLVCAATLFAGCAGLTGWEPAPLQVTEVRYAADVGRSPALAAAPASAGTAQPRGLGLSVGAVVAPLSGTGGRATADAHYSEIFENGLGIGASFILRRPTAGTVSIGDIYLLGSFELVRFEGKDYDDGITSGPVDTAMVISGWIDAKTMLAPMGADGAWKPYVLCGAGIVRMPSVTFANDIAINEASIELGLRGKIGIERRTGRLGLYVDIGVQLNTAPNVTDPPSGDAEPLIYTPIGAGVLVNF